MARDRDIARLIERMQVRRSHVLLFLWLGSILCTLPCALADDAGLDGGKSDAAILDGGLGDAELSDGAVRDDAAAPEDAAAEDASVENLLDPFDGEELLVESAPEPPPEPITPDISEPPRPPTDSSAVIRTLLGLVVLLALAWIASNPRVQRFEERVGISQVVTSGLPFVALGLLARAPGIDVLNDEVLLALTPLLQFGLGWIGFHTGFQFEGAAMEEVPRGTSSAVILLTGVSFAVIAGVTGVLLFALGLGDRPLTLGRDATIVGLAGALSAPTLERLSRKGVTPRARELARVIGILDDVVGVAALAMLFAWLHPRGSGWELPGVGWLFVTFGMAATLGLVMHAVLRGTDSSAESTAVLLGSVCFTAGMAGFFSIPPLVVCFLAGILLKNMPGGDKPRLAAAFARLERPIYLVFLVVVGALWKIGDYRGWLLLPVFVLARMAGRWAGARIARSLPAESRHPGLLEIADSDLIAPPMGALALAFVLTAQTLYDSTVIRAIVTAVIGGAVAMEVIVQVLARRQSSAPPSSDIEIDLSDL